jgi:hypothetical protein
VVFSPLFSRQLISFKPSSDFGIVVLTFSVDASAPCLGLKIKFLPT